MSDEDDRLSPESLEHYFRLGKVSNHSLSKEPRCILRIDPRGERLTLRTPYDGTEPTIRGFRHVETDVVEDEETWSTITVDAAHMHYEAYSLLFGVTEAMRGGANFGAAANAAVTNLRALLAARQRLSESQQLGLVGELLVLRELLDAAPEADVLDSWLGPASEQHDFAFADFDAEIKTTLSERRRHMISGTGQLRPNLGRPLWLVSIQLTRAGGRTGDSLAGLVAGMYDRLADHSRFAEALHGLGWRDEDADLYDTPYILRTAPVAFEVDDEFPAITDARLSKTVPRPDLVAELSYRIDVTDLTPGLPGAPLQAFLDPKDPTA